TVVFFFFSSRRRHTRSYGDWSSDVCSSDLAPWVAPCSSSSQPPGARCRGAPRARVRRQLSASAPGVSARGGSCLREAVLKAGSRSEERRVGKECRSRWAPECEGTKERQRS